MVHTRFDCVFAKTEGPGNIVLVQSHKRGVSRITSFTKENAKLNKELLETIIARVEANVQH